MKKALRDTPATKRAGGARVKSAKASKPGKGKAKDGGASKGNAPKGDAPKGDAPTIGGFAFDGPLPKAIREKALTSGGFPYDDKMDDDAYEETLLALQIELVKAQRWANETGERIVVLFEGRDGAGKGGTIQRFVEHLNPRTARLVALAKPTETEAGQWYFQRYVAHLPTAGEIALYDRSWYNRAGVEAVMGFARPEQTTRFLAEAPVFEAGLVRDGMRLFKFFLTIGREMQIKRLYDRFHDPLKQWKLSPLDFKAVEKWDDYSTAFDRLLAATHSETAPWTIVEANDKKRARLGAIRHLLINLPYPNKNRTIVQDQDLKIVMPAPDYLKKGGEPRAAR